MWHPALSVQRNTPGKVPPKRLAKFTSKRVNDSGLRGLDGLPHHFDFQLEIENSLNLMVAIRRTNEKLWTPLLHLPGRRDLIFSLTRRELAARYRGSFLGLLWVIITP